MKTKVTFLTFLAVAASICGMAQSTEELDDMYFTSKDRATLNTSKKVALSSENARRVTESETASVINPTDSYSARNVNPEYVASSKVNGSPSTVASYFSPNYIPTGVNQQLVRNCGTCGSSYTNYNSAYSPYSNYGYGMNPYSYGMMNPYNSFGNGFGNGFYQPGLSFGFGSFYGNGFASPFYNNYYGMGSYSGYGNYNNPYYNPYSYGYGGYGNSPTVIVVDRPRPQSSRNAEVNRYYSADGVRTTASAGGRVATSPTEYYNKTWRNDTQVARGSDTWNNSRSYQQNNNNNNWNNQNNWNNNNNGFGGFGGNRSSVNTGGSGGGNGGGAAPASSGGGSRRGRD
jgi:hypothetical protein